MDKNTLPQTGLNTHGDSIQGFADLIIKHFCAQCGLDMGNEWILGPVCGKCCRANHKKVTGG